MKVVEPFEEDRQMTAMAMAGAASGPAIEWRTINWGAAHRQTRRLQLRIAKAVRERRWGKVRALQRLLTTSFYGKVQAVRRVTENNGRRTPGIDGDIWDSPDKEAKAVKTLKRHGYRPSPLRRIYIPKANGKKRPLGIPTMKDRAMQALHLLALEPISETRADPNSYGFRPGRASRDAAVASYNALACRNRASFVLDADIAGCFDGISHSWLLAHIPMDKAILAKWLKSGFVWKRSWYPSDAGTPQGGIISPAIANMTLDGLETLLRQRFGKAGSNKACRHKVNLIRYADDFVVTGADPQILEDARTLIEAFLAERGLRLSTEKTQVVHISKGFDFLGWNVRKYDGKFLIMPAKKNVLAFLRKARAIIENGKGVAQEAVIRQLNPVIQGWANYHQSQVSSRTFHRADMMIWRKLWQWACRRHPKKSKAWIKDRYFIRDGLRNWVFAAWMTFPNGERKWLKLARASDVPIERHIKIKAEANAFDPAWNAYFESRLSRCLLESFRGRQRLRHLWRRQKGMCPHCQAPITEGSGWHVHHILPRAHGGADKASNLALLHPECHRQIHSRKPGHEPLVPRERDFREA
jgi:RNA-directed DNA polymerase